MNVVYCLCMNSNHDINMHSVFEHNYGATLVLDPLNDCILDANASACKLLGYTQPQMLNTRISQLFNEQMPELIVFTQAALEKGQAWSNDFKCCTHTNDKLSVELSASLLNSHNNELLILSLSDKAHLKRLREISAVNSIQRHGYSEWKTIEYVFQEIERENQLILKAAGEGIYGVNANGDTTFVNPAAERMLGWPAEELIGKNIHRAIHHSKCDGSHYASEDCPIYAAFSDGEIHFVDDEVFWRRDGSAISVEYTSTPIRDNGRLVGAVVIFRDITDRKQAEAKLRSALSEVEALKKRLEMENAYLQEEIRDEHNYKEIVGKSAAVLTIVRQIELVAPTDANVLITGESGTGKELIARAIHESSTRCNRPLIRVNCASIPRELFESEFFGHVKGAFTGATNDRTGRFELADGGTIFLDEVGEIPIELQSKLLRVLQEQQFERIGENKTRNVDVRIIAATNRDLKHEVSSQRFREDLFFRLNVFPIESVPLRERIEDISLLASHFLQRSCKKFNKTNLKLTIADLQKLESYPWPGNIREMINVIERAIILSHEDRLHIDLPESPSFIQSKNSATNTISSPIKSIITAQEHQQQEKENIIAALKVTHGKIFGNSGAAELLEMKPTTLTSRMKKLGIDRKNFLG